MKGITEKMHETLVRLYGENYADYQLSYRARLAMINTLLGDGFLAEFVFYEDTRQEALKKAEIYTMIYDVEVKENKEEGYLHFDSDFNGSIYHGLSCKIYYIVD